MFVAHIAGSKRCERSSRGKHDKYRTLPHVAREMLSALPVEDSTVRLIAHALRLK